MNKKYFLVLLTIISIMFTQNVFAKTQYEEYECGYSDDIKCVFYYYDSGNKKGKLKDAVCTVPNYKTGKTKDVSAYKSVPPAYDHDEATGNYDTLLDVYSPKPANFACPSYLVVPNKNGAPQKVVYFIKRLKLAEDAQKDLKDNKGLDSTLHTSTGLSQADRDRDEDERDEKNSEKSCYFNVSFTKKGSESKPLIIQTNVTFKYYTKSKTKKYCIKFPSLGDAETCVNHDAVNNNGDFKFKVNPDDYGYFWTSSSCNVQSKPYLKYDNGVYLIQKDPVDGQQSDIDQPQTDKKPDKNGEDNSGETVDPGKQDTIYKDHIGDNVCENVNVQNGLKVAGTILFVAKLFVPIIIIFFGTFEVYKAVIGGSSDSMSKQMKGLGIRVGIGVTIFIIPTLVNLALDQLEDFKLISSDIKNCQKCLLTPFECNPDLSHQFDVTTIPSNSAPTASRTNPTKNPTKSCSQMGKEECAVNSDRCYVGNNGNCFAKDSNPGTGGSNPGTGGGNGGGTTSPQKPCEQMSADECSRNSSRCQVKDNKCYTKTSSSGGNSGGTTDSCATLSVTDGTCAKNSSCEVYGGNTGNPTCRKKCIVMSASECSQNSGRCKVVDNKCQNK